MVPKNAHSLLKGMQSADNVVHASPVAMVQYEESDDKDEIDSIISKAFGEQSSLKKGPSMEELEQKIQM